MLLYIIIFILIFLIVFILSIFCMVKRELVIDNLYLIIPAICVGLWALHFLILQFQIYNKFYIRLYDFKIVYNCGLHIWTNPTKIYHIGFYYLPSYAVVLATTVCLFPYFIASYIFYSATFILALLSIREYNKILILMEVKKKIHRFIFLMIISNGFTVYRIFAFGQFKYMILVIFLFVIRRELQNRKNQIEKDFKYNFINYSLLAFAIGIFPFFILLFLIYLFQDISFHELLKTENIKKYCLIISIFALENFLFFIYPSLFFDFVGLFQRFNEREWSHRQLPNYYLAWINLDDYSLFFTLSTIFIVIITLVLIYNKNLRIEEKFGYFSLAVIFISMYARRLFLVLFPLAYLLFIPFLYQEEKDINFFKKNKFFLIGLVSGFAIYFMDPHNQIIEFFFPYLEGAKWIEFRWIIFVCIFGIDILILHMKNYRFMHN